MTHPLNTQLFHVDVTRQPAPAADPLAPPIRNRYFYGKLLDALHLDMEQDYFNGKRHLLNRLGLGAGVMCGLGIQRSGDTRRILIDPGVAVDSFGREIIVPQRTVSIDPRQLTDDLGAPQGAALTVAVSVIIGIAYRECDVEPTAALVCECDDRGCEYGAVRERYAVVVKRATSVSSGAAEVRLCDELFARNAKIARPTLWEQRKVEVATMGIPCRAPTVGFVPLAEVNVADDGTVSAPDYRVRTPIVSNVVLLDLILCLASELDVCCGKIAPPRQQAITLAANSATMQVVPRGGLAGEPPSVLVQIDGAPAAGETVHWSVGQSGGFIGDAAGSDVASLVTTTGADGTSTLDHWRMPRDSGNATVVAAVDNATPASVTFNAKVEDARQAAPPTITAVVPAQGATLKPAQVAADREWRNHPFIDITFDEEMLNTDVTHPTSDWLRVAIAAKDREQALLTVASPGFVQGRAAAGGGFTYRFKLDPKSVTHTTVSVVVLVRAENNNIRSRNTNLLLDPDFAGGVLTAPNAAPQPGMPKFDEVWDPSALTAQQRSQLAQQIIDRTDSLNPVPAFATSTSQTPGGLYHSFFIIET